MLYLTPSLATHKPRKRFNATKCNQNTNKKFSVAKCKIVPHVGWNKIEIKQNILTQNINNLKRFYFCHSYYFEPASEKNIMLTTDYHIKFCSGIYKKNIFGIQFHPEKSLNDGIKLISNFVNIS